MREPRAQRSGRNFSFTVFTERAERPAEPPRRTFRPLADTARDILAWFDAQPAERQTALRGPLPPQRERELLALWDQR